MAVLVSGVRIPVLSGATNRFLSENRKPIDRISLYQQVPSRFMRKFICRLRLNEVSRQ